MENAKIASWSEEYLTNNAQNANKQPKLTFQDGDQKTITFLDEGTKNVNEQYGTSIIFKVKCENQELVWFVSAKKYTILTEIAHQKPITGKTAKVTRVGKEKKDTRWSIKFIPATTATEEKK